MRKMYLQSLYSQAVWILYEMFPTAISIATAQIQLLQCVFFLTRWYLFPGPWAVYTELQYSAIFLIFTNSSTS